MTAQQLKNSILQMAMQGKLVPQDPGDEPASVLLERIKAEKQELIKAGKIKKDKKSSEIFRGASRNLPYAFCEQIGKEIRDISDEIPFEIPDSWEWVRLGVISSLVTKGTTPRGGNVSYLDSGIGFLRAENVAGMDVLDTSKMNYIDEETHNGFLKRSILYENDLLITIAGTLGRTAIVRKHNLPLNANQAVSIIRLVNTNEFDLMYLICALNSPLIQKMLTEQKKITAIPNLTLEIIYDCFIPIPPVEEQHRIVAKIEELLPYIDKYGKAEENLTALNTTFPESLKKSILQEAVQGKLVPQNPDDEPASVLLERIRAEKQALIKAGKIKRDKHESVIVTRDKIPYEIIDGKERCIADEVPFELPENWCWCRLKSIINAVSARRVHQSDWKNSGIPFYRAREIAKLAENGYVDNELFISEELFAEYAQSGVPKSGDLMVTAVGTLGKTYIVRDTDKFYYKDASVICFENYGKLCSEYLRYLMMSPYMETVIKDNSSGTTVGTITLVRANEYLIPLPPLAEQKRIVEKIEELMQYCDKL